MCGSERDATQQRVVRLLGSAGCDRAPVTRRQGGSRKPTGWTATSDALCGKIRTTRNPRSKSESVRRRSPTAESPGPATIRPVMHEEESGATWKMPGQVQSWPRRRAGPCGLAWGFDSSPGLREFSGRAASTTSGLPGGNRTSTRQVLGRTAPGLAQGEVGRVNTPSRDQSRRRAGSRRRQVVEKISNMDLGTRW